MSEFCRKCNAETERNASGRCKPCAKARKSAWYAANRDKDRAKQSAYRAANREKLNARSTAYRAANPDRVKTAKAAWHAENRDEVLAKMAAYRAANRDEIRTKKAAWRAANPERVKAKDAAWYAANPEKKRIHRQNRRARKMESGGKLSNGLAERLYKLQRGKCACGCKQPLGDNYHLDHIMPLALGGTNEDENIQLLRATCNLRKHDKHPVEFMQQRGFLL